MTANVSLHSAVEVAQQCRNKSLPRQLPTALLNLTSKERVACEAILFDASAPGNQILDMLLYCQPELQGIVAVHGMTVSALAYFR